MLKPRMVLEKQVETERRESKDIPEDEPTASALEKLRKALRLALSPESARGSTTPMLTFNPHSELGAETTFKRTETWLLQNRGYAQNAI